MMSKKNKMKPWEGKHFKTLEESLTFPELDMLNIDRVIEALKKDWEEQQENLTSEGKWLNNFINGEKACAQTAESEKSGHQESSKDALAIFRQRAKKNPELEIAYLEEKKKFHDEKKAESFTSSNEYDEHNINSKILRDRLEHEEKGGKWKE